mgnify:CR=1 FL=1|tara:strand:- start:120 stop:698 length:579 start_codon:yes stop_codon:yes gene_type:complete
MILSFDIGIKNLAYCILYKNKDNTITIEKWDNLQLLEDDEKCKGFPLNEITKRMYNKLNTELEDYDITEVLLENQPCLKNPVMKSIQMIIYGFFQYQTIILGRKINNIKLINASNKLKVGKNLDEINNKEYIIKIKNKYTRNKKLAIEYTNWILEHRIKNHEKLYEYFNNNKKKDDLADSFLQGLYYINLSN